MEEISLKKLLKGYLIGFLSAAILLGGVAYAANVVKIVIDGTEITPRDANGKRVDPIIIDGTTYLPVRAVAEALGKEVYWDGPRYTVYLGKMDGKLEYPTIELQDLNSIAKTPDKQTGSELTDNYGNTYTRAIGPTGGNQVWEYLLNMKYTRLKGTLYVESGTRSDSCGTLTVIADGKRIYTSPEMGKTSSPVKIDVNITGCNDLKIEFSGEAEWYLSLAEAGLYQ